jgi:hypothetical protein
VEVLAPVKLRDYIAGQVAAIHALYQGSKSRK